MIRRITRLAAIHILIWQAGVLHSQAASRQKQSTHQLEQRLEQIDGELLKLARDSLRSGAGSIGYRSKPYKTANHPEWVQIDLGDEFPIDEIILVPAIARHAKDRFQSEGFPLRFRIIAGSSDNKQGTVIASFSEKDNLLPRIAPLVVPCPGTVASWVRIEGDQLTSRKIDGYFLLQLSELLVFSGQKNVALRRPITCPTTDTGRAWGPQFLTDGSVPYLMDSADSVSSRAFLKFTDRIEKPSLTIDLETTRPISGISLHTTEQDDTIPQSHLGDLGIPRHFQVEGALQTDFSDAALLLDARCSTIYDISPMMSWNLPSTPCRYVRLTVLEPYIFDHGQLRRERIAFAEIELFADGLNVALGKPISFNFIKSNHRLGIPLTDGLNFYGRILTIRDWMNQLARRHNLESERPRVATELNHRYVRQRILIRQLLWLTALMAIAVLVSHVIRLRKTARMKKRFAADLHDELGANVHSIGLLSDFAERAIDSPDKLRLYLQRIRALTERTGRGIRHCTNMLEARNLFTDLKADMQRTAQRIVTELEHDFTIEGECYLEQLSPRVNKDLFLFYKESLININRHANASQISTRLSADKHGVQLSISDNGCGTSGAFPSSLKRRAQLLRAKLSVESSEENGTKIILRLRRNFKT